MIDDAKKELPAKHLPLTLALFHEAMGRTEQAGKQYETAKANPNDAILPASCRHVRDGQRPSSQSDGVAAAGPIRRGYGKCRSDHQRRAGVNSPSRWPCREDTNNSTRPRLC